jgi:hypothetical protein
MDRRSIGCVTIAIILVIVGTFSTAVLPSTPTYQAVAGGIIVFAFALIFLCLRD